MKRKTRHLHFVGIGGIGMSGIAEVFLNQGHQVTGSDLSESSNTKKLKKLGGTIFKGHRASQVGDADVVVVSSAVQADNPEIVEAKKRRIPVIPRAEMLGELMRGKTGVAVAGTHGKTTATSILATILTHAGFDPTIVTGGIVDSLGGNAKLGQGEIVVAEADESDGSFLHLPATYGIITNIDNDHLDHFGSIEQVDQAFALFVGKLPFYGMAAVCGDDAGVQRCISKFTKPILTFGFSERCDVRATQLERSGLSSRFHVLIKDGNSEKRLGEVTLNVPGEHNVINALGAITIANHFEVPFEKIQKGLAEFRGVQRRFEIIHQDEKQAIVSDYGHHPTEILATLKAARNFWDGRIVTLFQPHRYSRTLHCKDGFRSCFRESDLTLISDIYAASEAPIDGVSSGALATDLQKNAGKNQKFIYSGDLEETCRQAVSEVKDGDLVICMGAGTVWKLPQMLLEKMKK